MLTENNYFSTESSRAYMSASQLKRFLECEALALAELNGEYQRESTTALLVGSYVDAHFSGTLEQFRATHSEIYTNKGSLRAEFSQAQDIIAYLEADPLLMAMSHGELQKIVTGEIAGVQFKGKLDVLLDEAQCQKIAEDFPEMAKYLLMAPGAIVDWKIMRDMEAVYAPGAGRVSFVESWKYDLSMGIYQRLVGNNYPCFLLVATKEKQPDKALIHLPDYMMTAALDSVMELIPHFNTLKQGYGQAERCESCAWCRQTKRIIAAIEADELEGAGV